MKRGRHFKSACILEPQGRWKWCRVKPVWVLVLAVALASPSTSKDLPLAGGSRVDLAVLTTVASGAPRLPLWIPSQRPPFPGRADRRAGSTSWTLLLAPMKLARFMSRSERPRTLVSAQGDVDLKQTTEIPDQLVHQLSPRAGGVTSSWAQPHYEVTRRTGSPRGCLLDQSFTDCLLLHP